MAGELGCQQGDYQDAADGDDRRAQQAERVAKTPRRESSHCRLPVLYFFRHRLEVEPLEVRALLVVTAAASRFRRNHEPGVEGFLMSCRFIRFIGLLAHDPDCLVETARAMARLALHAIEHGPSDGGFPVSSHVAADALWFLLLLR